MSYNLTQISDNTTGIVTLMQGVNDVLVDGWFGILLLIGISAVIFISMQIPTGNTRASIMATSFISFGLCVFLAAMELVPDLAIFVTLVITAASVGFSFVNN